jgi:transcriptional regulator with XRE-family HTH domain
MSGASNSIMDGNLRRLREHRALSRQDLAEKSGVNESTIYRSESGKTRLRPSTIRRLSRALDVEPEELTYKQGTFAL